MIGSGCFSRRSNYVRTRFRFAQCTSRRLPKQTTVVIIALWDRMHPIPVHLLLPLCCFQDVLAVGYGQFAFGDDKQGLVCCWSIKNPEVRITMI